MMRFPLIRSLCLSAALCGTAFAGNLDNWSHAAHLTCSGYNGEETLTGFPVLVRLSPATVGGFAYDQMDDPVAGSDLRFTVDGETALPREIETWNTNGESLIWVRLPSLASAADGFDMVWGGGLTHTGTESAWDAGAVGVWHMNQVHARDSGPNALHGQAYGSVAVEPGLVGDACSFVADSSYIDIGSNTLFQFGTNDFTLSAWVRSDPLADYEGLMGTYGNSTRGYMLLIHSTGNILNFYGAGAYYPSGTAVTDNVWTHVAYQRDGTNAFFYVNGARIARVNPAALNAGYAFHIGGAGPNWASYRFDGLLDEVRVDAVARSSNWVWTTWFQTASNAAFLTYGPAVPRLTPGIGAEPPTDVTTDAACLNASLLSTGGSETAVTLYWGPSDGGSNAAAWAVTNTFVPHTGASFPAAYTQAVSFAPGAWRFHRFAAENAAGTVWAGAGDPILAGEVALEVADAIGSETGRSVTVTVTRPAWSTNLPLTVSYTLAGSALNGTDYSNLTGAVTFPVEADQASIPIVPINDFLYEGAETVVLTLAPGPYAVGASNTVTLTIEEANKVVHVATNGAAVPPFADWANAAVTIQAGVDVAAEGDTVLVGPGTYTGPGTGSLYTQCVTVAKNIRLESADGPTATVIDAQSVTRQRGLLVTNAPRAVVSGFTFRRGKVDGTYDHGGGIFLVGGTLTNCHVRDNYARGYGGGLYLKGGLVTDCVVASNLSLEWSYGAGGGVYVVSGELANSYILTNTCLSSAGGGGIWLADGLVRNCLIAYNIATRASENATSPGGGLRMAKGSVVHCTIVSNVADAGGGGIYMTGGGVTNCIVADNRTGPFGHPSGLTWNIDRVGGAVATTCSSPLQPGDGNLDAIPVFVDPAGDFRLAPGSPCRDAALPSESPARDLDGAARPVDGDGDGAALPDMGAYEAGSVATGGLRCAFTVSTNEGFKELAATFTASVAGAETGGLAVAWNLNKDRAPAMTAEGVDLLSVSTNFGPGWYSVELSVSNGLGETARYERTDFIRVAPETAYADPAGGHVPPFLTPANAATSLLEAVAVSGDAPGTGTVIRLAAGVYTTPAVIQIERAIRLVGESGPAATLVQSGGSTFRPFIVSHPDARLEGLSVKGAAGAGNYYYGGALRLHNGTVSNCVFRDTRIGGAGGAVYMTNGLMTHCTIASNSVTEWQLGYGGGLYLSGGRVEYTLFASNTTLSHQGGGAVYMTGGTLRNCLATNNAGRWKTAPNYSKGGAVRMTGGLIESCTIADNFSEGPGGGVYLTGGSILNSIVYFNQADPRNLESLYNLARVPDTAGTVSYSCSTPLPTGTSNLHLDPSFVDRAGGDYGLTPASPCADVGSTQGWMTDALDFTGSARIINEAVDIGAFEAPDASAGPLVINFSTPDTSGFTNLTAVFTASALGSDANVTYYWWDFNVDGTPVMTLDGTDLAVVTNGYGPGLYSVRLVAMNGSGEYATNLQENLVLVAPDTLYVSTTGTPRIPYLSWETAAASVHDAVLAASGAEGALSTIRVGPGVYSNSSPVNIAKPVTVLGVDGAEATILRHSDGRIVHLNHPQAGLTGLTLANGRLTGTYDQGAGVLLEAGTVSNCVIRDCTNLGQGGGAHVKGGLLTDCLIVSNSVTEWQYGYGGGIYISSGLVDRCRVVSNVTRSHRGGGGLYLNGGAVRNSLIAWNEARPTGNPPNFGDAGGAVVTKGVLENCTVVFNTASTNCGGVMIEGAAGGVTNCIVIYNRVTNDTALAQDFLNPVRTRFSCSPDLTDGVDGNITADPLFVSTNAADFRLDRLSPCREAGTNAAWMTEGGLDLGGRPRLLGPRVDMGAHEADSPRRGILFLVY